MRVEFRLGKTSIVNACLEVHQSLRVEMHQFKFYF